MKRDNDIDIDMNRLDEEWRDQPKLFFEASMQLAEARLDMDEAKANLEIVAAELELKIRRHPEKYGLQKATDRSISAVIAVSKDHQEAVRKLSNARFAANVLQVRVDVLEHKKKALELLVYLYGSNYFSEPRVKDGEKVIGNLEAKRAFSRRKRDA